MSPNARAGASDCQQASCTAGCFLLGEVHSTWLSTGPRGTSRLDVVRPTDVSLQTGAWRAWCGERDQAVTGVPGNLALVAFLAVGDEPLPVEQAPGVTVRSAGGGVLSWRAADGTTVRLAGHGPQSRIHRDRWWFEAFSLDGRDVELRVYDELAPALRTFGGIERWEFDERWVLPAVFAPRPEVEAVPWGFTRAVDDGHRKRVPGTVALELEGERHELTAFLDGSTCVLVFADATTGEESYRPGRFLVLDVTPGPSAVPFRLDLNRAFLPPCAFSDAYSCPVPPPQNRLPVPVRAGERRVRPSGPGPV